MVTRHDECMLRTAELELDLYGHVLSNSVLDHVKSWGQWMLWEQVVQCGGSRTLTRLYGHLTGLPEPLPDPGIRERR